MKRIISLFLLAIISFLLFSYITEYENLILPFLRRGKSDYSGIFKEGKNEEVFRGFLAEFNRGLSEVYLSSDVARVSQLPLSDEMKNGFHEEMIFLRNKNWVMDYKVTEFNILEIERLSPVATHVKVRERTEIGYLDGSGNRLYPPVAVEYDVTYVISAGPEGFIVTGIEVAPAEGKVKDGKG